MSMSEEYERAVKQIWDRREVRELEARITELTTANLMLAERLRTVEAERDFEKAFRIAVDERLGEALGR